MASEQMVSVHAFVVVGGRAVDVSVIVWVGRHVGRVGLKLGEQMS
jgi:ribosomal protein S5